ncbi:MAG TPA: rhomboid family intramembrane serine protease [Desulfuromonadales bacterium]
MFLPIGDTPNPRGVPYVNILLIGVNVAVFLLVSLPLTFTRPDLNDPLLFEYLRAVGARGNIPAQAILQQLSAYDLFIFRFGFRPSDPSLTTLFTAMFLHGGWLHLVGNMLFLWIYGDNVENRLGRIGYLLAYLGSGMAATLFFALFVPGSDVPMVGASGAISGVLGFYYLWFPRNQVKVFIFLFPFIMNTFLFPARLVLGFYLLVDNLIPFLVNSGAATGVAHGAHIGGFVAGLALAFGIDRLPGRQAVRQERKAAAREKSAPLEASTEAVARSLRQGEPEKAARLYFLLGSREQRRQLAAEDILAIGDFLLESRMYDAALSVFRRFLAERPADPEIDRAYLGAGKALVHQPRSAVAAYQYFLAALDAARSGEVADEARMHLGAIERLGGRG